MDIKNIFLNKFISEKVYVEQPFGFEDHNFLNHIFKLHKALYSLKQASHAWYERLNKFLIKNSFTKGSIDTTLFLKKRNDDLLIV